MTKQTGMTARQLISALSNLPPGTLIKTTEHDSEWGRTYVWSVSGVNDEGYLGSLDLIESHGDDEEWCEDD